MNPAFGQQFVAPQTSPPASWLSAHDLRAVEEPGRGLTVYTWDIPSMPTTDLRRRVRVLAEGVGSAVEQ
ncbi:MAG: hypothetical protein ABIO70_28770, partial [Pseudomonadota bacterium]